ncbi:MAG TPA: sigma-70 family RNA polymerase sigma factor [Puia sp.]|nr:sigma-70 family RNA polymerase sigma factor [Puia sp.]
MKTDRNEQFLLKGLAENNRKVIETIYKENYKMVQTLITGNNGSVEDAKDIFQESMIVLYEKVRSGSFELNCQIKTYLYSVCRRLWLKRLSQAQRNSPEIENIEETVPVEEDLDMHGRRDADFHIMEKAMMSLGEPCKSLLEAYYIQKKNMVEIADSFGYTNADNAKNQKYKCLMRLKKLFFDQYKNRD